MGLDIVGLEVDHRDHDGLNCARDNVRIATGRQNMANQPTRADNKSGYKGVFRARNSKRYTACVRLANGRNKYVASETCPESAARIRDMWAREAYGEFAYLNFPGPA
jgi:hypothetical protein